MKVTAMILAGKRAGALDPLAQRAGVAQKCVVPVLGIPMVERVAKEVAGCDAIGDIRIVAHDAEEIAALPAIAALRAEGRLIMRPGAFNLVDSVVSGAQGGDFPILVTTADNCLVTSEGYGEFIEKALADGAMAAAALARKDDVIAADPMGQTKFYQFRDGGYSNCNTYWIGSREALGAAEIMRGGGQFVKFPSRIAKAFGVMNLIRFYLGWGTKESFFKEVSKRFGFKMSPIVMSKGDYAIDVDNQRTFEVTERLLKMREHLPV